MRLGSRRFVIDAEDGSFRAALATFAQVLRDAANHLGEFVDRWPVRCDWSALTVLAFDAPGRIDAARLLEEQPSRAAGPLSLQAKDAARKTMVIDATA